MSKKELQKLQAQKRLKELQTLEGLDYFKEEEEISREEELKRFKTREGVFCDGNDRYEIQFEEMQTLFDKVA